MNWVWNEVDGVTTLRIDHDPFPGPLSAGLVFGVGRADETMLVTGITHVVEHLALQPLAGASYAWNGQVEAMATRFYARGTPEQVSSHYGALAGNLRNLPLARLDDEARVLRIEEEGRGRSQVGLDLTTRFGARGPGLLGWQEHGLNRLDPDEVAQWVETYFTAANAVLWITGEIPRDLDLSALPTGPAPARGFEPPIALPARTWVDAKTRAVSLSMLARQQDGVLPMMSVLSRRAFQELRVRDALTYSIEFVHLRLPDGRALEYFQADGSEESHPKLLEGLVGIVDDLATAGPTDDEMTTVREASGTLPDDPQSTAGFLDSTAERHLLGLPTEALEARRDVLVALTADQLVADLCEILPSLVGIGPEALGREPEGWAAHHPWSAAPVDGTAYEPILDREVGTLVVGADGATWIDPEARVATVLWNEAVVGFTWDNGSRAVVGPDGLSVFLVPWNWRGAQGLTELVDAAIEPERRIRMGEGTLQYLRDPDDPSSTTDVRWLGTLTGLRYRGERIDLVVDTDGMFLLYSQQTAGFMRSMERDELLGLHARNTWIPVVDIERAAYAKQFFGRPSFSRVKGTLTVCLRDGQKIELKLVSEEHVDLARRAFQMLLGPLFES